MSKSAWYFTPQQKKKLSKNPLTYEELTKQYQNYGILISKKVLELQLPELAKTEGSDMPDHVPTVGATQAELPYPGEYKSDSSTPSEQTNTGQFIFQNKFDPDAEVKSIPDKIKVLAALSKLGINPLVTPPAVTNVANSDSLGTAKIAPVSQKAKGLLALYSVLKPKGMAPLIYPYLTRQKLRQAFTNMAGKPIMARPCPKTPRHGFVDSRPITTISELLAISREIREKAPEEVVEIILMPMATAKASGIITHNSIAFGPSHDSVTSGNGGITLPAVINDSILTKAIGVSSLILKNSDVDISEAYIEFVEHNGKTLPVQVRRGTVPPATVNYVPKDMQVNTVVSPDINIDLLEWEKQAKLLPVDGTVVYLNGALTSHVAVHAISRGIAVVTSHLPKVGDTLQKSSQMPMNPDTLNFWIRVYMCQTVKEGKWEFEAISNKVGAAASIIHSFPLWGAGQEQVMAWGITFLTKAAIACCLGERRFKDGTTKGKERHVVYAKAFNTTLPELRPFLNEALHCFMTAHWGGGFGGKKWANCSNAVIKVMEAIAKLNQGKANITKVNTAVSTANKLLYVCHNGGALLNKYKCSLDTASKQPAYYLMHVDWMLDLLDVNIAIKVEDADSRLLTKEATQLDGTNSFVYVKSAKGVTSYDPALTKSWTVKSKPLNKETSSYDNTYLENVEAKVATKIQIRHLNADKYRLQIMFDNDPKMYYEFDIIDCGYDRVWKVLETVHHNEKSMYGSGAVYASASYAKGNNCGTLTFTNSKGEKVKVYVSTSNIPSVQYCLKVDSMMILSKLATYTPTEGE